MHATRTEKGHKESKASAPKVDPELESLKKSWCARRDELRTELTELKNDPRYNELVRDLLNLIKALDVRERLLDARETSMANREVAIEGQKQRLSLQAERLAQLRNELETKINELDRRLGELEDTE